MTLIMYSQSIRNLYEMGLSSFKEEHELNSYPQKTISYPQSYPQFIS